MTKEKPAYLKDDEFLMLFFKAAVDYGTHLVRTGDIPGVDETYPFIDWLYSEADVKPPENHEYWEAINKNYDTASTKYGQGKNKYGG